MHRLAQTFVAVRDLANSPIQTLAIESELLRLKCPEAAEIAQRIKRTTTRLQKLNAILDQQMVDLRPENGDESFDARAILESLKKKPEDR